ncbi:MAG TPA: hypothetical protein ENG87_04035 [Candidatus Pacearchaeota archaeon]|nr:hypothetical protein [Candidatus Pacearchaeota archaeon]HDZ61201.1 hypothetical protein [Candidatus Pacearchaeota archaeon]
MKKREMTKEELKIVEEESKRMTTPENQLKYIVKIAEMFKEIGIQKGKEDFASLLKEEVTKNASKEDGCIHHFNVHEIIDKHTGKKSMEEKE